MTVTADPKTKTDHGTKVYAGFFVTFNSLYGPLPLMTPKDPAAVRVSRYRAGDAPFRQAVQVVKCSLLGDAPASTTFSLGAYTSMPVLAGASTDDVADAWSQVGPPGRVPLLDFQPHQTHASRPTHHGSWATAPSPSPTPTTLRRSAQTPLPTPMYP